MYTHTHTLNGVLHLSPHSPWTQLQFCKQCVDSLNGFKDPAEDTKPKRFDMSETIPVHPPASSPQKPNNATQPTVNSARAGQWHRSSDDAAPCELGFGERTPEHGVNVCK